MSIWQRAVVLACAGVTALTGSLCGGPVSAAPTDTPAREVARVLSVSPTTPTRATVTVYSPAMERPVRVSVLLPHDRSKPRPTLYLLDGIDGGIYTNYTQSGWTFQTDIVKFMADKPVNVVMPIGGMAAYYTDWQRTDPVLGRNKWETFLTKELPPLIDKRFTGNGRNVIGGLSMGALGAMSIAVRHPDLYRGVAAFSGCLDQSSTEFRQATAASVSTRGGNPDNMWGPLGHSRWDDHNPAAHVAALRGKPIYVAVGNGLPDPSLGIAGLASPVGGVLEGIVLQCTQSFKRRADTAGVKATYDFRSGLHSWGYWNQDLHRAWPTLAKGLGVER
ncbi:alpha/beta hydrolase family protein [Gordonia westfalica]|uniref:Alpha/beta hydrolase family protein n=1 Tax=Gordonia westfalica TaxID=158898 RepID=A0ABU2GU45_9ACTN|nr:alpha/beta hydrolase family protein [Gordonia westfalica]MDS1114973.1 alpha/beta hydrolase family protein [Gordonia westfalica]